MGQGACGGRWTASAFPTRPPPVSSEPRRPAAGGAGLRRRIAVEGSEASSHLSTIRRVSIAFASALALGGGAAAAAAWGVFEAGWVRLRELDVELPGLPPELDGLRIAHLSDFHLGLPSLGTRAVERAVAWTAARRPDLVCITGDLLSHPRGEARLRALLERLDPCYAILGNHDIGVRRDPFSKAHPLAELGGTTLLFDEAVELELRGRRVLVAGLDPASRWREPDLGGEADLRILLAHFPDTFGRIGEDSYDLVLSGHMHDGQICVPLPRGKLRLAHPSAPYACGLYRRGPMTMHVSPGLGTTFVPIRFFARPEATELRLRSPRGGSLGDRD